MSDKTPAVLDDGLWAGLRRLTAARIGLQRTGASLATGPLLDFKLAHARARDAVHEPLDEARLIADLARLGTAVLGIASAAEQRQQYLMRPDLGRRLAPGAEAALARHAGRYDVVFVIADGLSARAVQTHAEPTLAAVLPTLRAEGLSIAPLAVVRHGRVAIGDAIAALLGADCVAVLIGERPGLTAPGQHGRLSDLAAGTGHDGCGPQLHLQHPPGRHRLCGRRPQARAHAARHARKAHLRRAA